MVKRTKNKQKYSCYLNPTLANEVKKCKKKFNMSFSAIIERCIENQLEVKYV